MRELPAPLEGKLARQVGGFIAGSVAWPVVLGAGFVLLRASWPGYVGAQPEKAYTLAMLACRLLIYGSAIVATSAVAAWVGRTRRLAWFAGVVIFAFSVPPHLYPGTVWDDYPVWYHLLYLSSILPLCWLGGRLAGRGFGRMHS